MSVPIAKHVSLVLSKTGFQRGQIKQKTVLSKAAAKNRFLKLVSRTGLQNWFPKKAFKKWKLLPQVDKGSDGPGEGQFPPVLHGVARG